MNFITCDWDDSTVHVTLFVRDYPVKGVSLDDLKPLIHEIRAKSTSMIIRVDMNRVPLTNMELFKVILKIVKEVVDYTQDDKLLQQIRVVNTGFVFRTLYKPISLAIPKCFRDIITFGDVL